MVFAGRNENRVAGSDAISIILDDVFAVCLNEKDKLVSVVAVLFETLALGIGNLNSVH